MGSDRLRVERVRGPACAAAPANERLYETGTRCDLSPRFLVVALGGGLVKGRGEGKKKSYQTGCSRAAVRVSCHEINICCDINHDVTGHL